MNGQELDLDIPKVPVTTYQYTRIKPELTDIQWDFQKLM